MGQIINCSVTVMPIYKGKIGFIKREKGDSYSEQLVAPGGKLEETDGKLISGVPYWSVEYAAIREMAEETGLSIQLEQLKYFCSLTLPNGRVVISLYAELTDEQGMSLRSGLMFYTPDEIWKRKDFAPGMKEEAGLLAHKLGI